jgi:3-deoxy-D-manno-octulosonic acid kinase
MQEQELRSRGAGILYDADSLRKYASVPTTEWFVPEYWRAQGVLQISPGGRGAVAFIRHDAGAWVLRHYRRGGLIARIVSDRYVWTGADRTRGYREWRLLAQLCAWGLPVPEPIAARYVRTGWSYRADLITAAVPDVETLSERLIAGRIDSGLWQSVGTTIAQFHRRGVQHADLNAHNILIDRTGRVFVLDFDRGRIRVRGGWEERVLARLHRSLLKISAQDGSAFDESNWAALMAGYRGAMTQGE